MHKTCIHTLVDTPQTKKDGVGRKKMLNNFIVQGPSLKPSRQTFFLHTIEAS